MKLEKVGWFIGFYGISTFVGYETQFFSGSGHIDTAIRVHYMDANKTAGEEARRQLHKNAASWRQHPTRHQLYATCLLSQKLFKLDEPDMQETAGEAGTIS